MYVGRWVLYLGMLVLIHLGHAAHPPPDAETLTFFPGTRKLTFFFLGQDAVEERGAVMAEVSATAGQVPGAAQGRAVGQSLLIILLSYYLLLQHYVSSLKDLLTSLRRALRLKLLLQIPLCRRTIEEGVCNPVF